MRARIIVFAVLALVFGCQGTGRRFISNPGRGEVLRVVSGDRIYFDLDESSTVGYKWDYICHDPDVEVTIDHVATGRAEVCIRIHRGYDGPSNVHFVFRHPWKRGKPEKEFDIGLYKRTGDVAFWE